MTLWMQWLNALDGFLEFLSSHVGLGDGLAIVALTLIVRTAILPISWSSAYRSCIRQKTIARLQPELQRLKEKFGDQPKMYAEQLVALYRENGMTLTDGRTLLGALVQLNPDLPEHMRLMLIIVPSIVAVVVALKVASALALYWTTSNCYSAVQTAVLHHVVARRIQSGALKI